MAPIDCVFLIDVANVTRALAIRPDRVDKASFVRLQMDGLAG
jgi:hypothetical protein